MVSTVNAQGHVVDQLTLTYHNPPETAPANAALLVNSGGLYEDYIRVSLPPSANFDDLQVSEGVHRQCLKAQRLGRRKQSTVDLV